METLATQLLHPGERDLKVLKAGWNSPRAYVVYVDSAHQVWVSDVGANGVLHFHPAAERFTATYPRSGPNARVRQISGRQGEALTAEVGARTGRGLGA